MNQKLCFFFLFYLKEDLRSRYLLYNLSRRLFVPLRDERPTKAKEQLDNLSPSLLAQHLRTKTLKSLKINFPFF